MSQPPLVVDLDGTLLRSDLLLETAVAFVRSEPLSVLKPLGWLAGGKAALKEQLARATDIDVTVLPYDDAVLARLAAEKRDGRRLVLATASHELLAERVATHLGLFDEVLATADGHNLSAHNKRDTLLARFGDKGFDYLGNSADDLPVWAAARQAWLVNAGSAVERRARAQGNVTGVIGRPAAGTQQWLKALRLHQWPKNLLIFVPLLAAHRLTDPALVWQGVLAFLFFGLCASSVYLLNDLLDLADDRHHPAKRQRPFAAGHLSIGAGLLAFPALLAGAFAGALLLLPTEFAGVLAAYYLVTLTYSLVLKRHMAVDVITLAMLYTLRIVAGAAALGLSPTSWMLAFSMFIFLSLALIKRYTELHDAQRRGHNGKARGRGYYADDLPMVSSLGAASGYLAVMVLALYIDDQATAALYTHPQLIWLACPLLLFWITRAWMLAHRGQMHDDPVIFAIRDRTSLVTGALFGLVFWIAT